MSILIRAASETDMPAVHALITELAVFEKAPEAVTNTVEDMIRDGFGSSPVFHCLVATDDNTVVGMAIYFIKYSTWKGKGVYLDDLVVTESYRKRGVGKLLLDAVLKHSAELNAKQVHWQVLDWNTPAIEFYKKYKVEFDSEWVNCKLSQEQLTDLVNQSTL